MALKPLCPTAARLWDAAAAAAGTAADVADLEAHLRDCPACRRDDGPAAPTDGPEGPFTLLLDLSDPTPPARPAGTSPPAWGADPEPATATRFGRYLVEGRLGRGGMGLVVKAYDPVLDRTVAIKVLHPYLAAAADARQAFLKEARAAAAIHHEHVVPVYTAEEDGGTAYLVMQYVAGGSLQQRLDNGPRPTRAEMVDVARQAARGLAAAHAKGLVHRDVKPANLMIEDLPDGGRRVKVTDFGLAHAVADPLPEAPGLVAGTAAYMAPEQAMGKPVDARADLYALGVVMYEMATGRLPFVSGDPSEVLRHHVLTDPPRLSQVAPGGELAELDEVIYDLMRKDPAGRPQTALEVVHRLDRVAADGLLTTAERARLAALRRLRVLDSDPEPALDDLTFLASHICGTPIALVSLVDEDRQWLKSKVGLSIKETARNISFCTHVVDGKCQMVVPDATRDPRFKDNPLVRAAPDIRFYAGMPLITSDGFAVGSMCVIDRQPRQLTSDQLSALAAISRLVLSQLELRRDVIDLKAQLGHRPDGG